MPTVTRLVAGLAFYMCGVFAGHEYAKFFEEPAPSAGLAQIVGIIAGLVGWYYVGRRINRHFLDSIFQCFQGALIAILLAAISYATTQVFIRGYDLRYRSLEEAVQGFFGLVSEHVLRMTDMSFLLMLAGMIVMLGGILTLFFRWAEARRLRK